MPQQTARQRWLIRSAWALAIACLFFALNTNEKQMTAIENAFAYLNVELSQKLTK